MKRPGFRSGMVRDLLGLSYKRIEHYDRGALVQPDLQRAKGRGSRRLYSRDNLAELAVLKKLLDRGLSLEKIRRALRTARKRLPGIKRPLRDLRFITDGTSIYVYEKEQGGLVDLLNPRQPVLTAAVEGAAEALDATIGAIAAARIELLTLGGRHWLVEVVEEADGAEVIARCPDLYGISEKGRSAEEALSALSARMQDALRHLK